MFFWRGILFCHGMPSVISETSPNATSETKPDTQRRSALKKATACHAGLVSDSSSCLFQHLILFSIGSPACCDGVPDWHGRVQKTVGIVKDANRILMPFLPLEKFRLLGMPRHFLLVTTFTVQAFPFWSTYFSIASSPEALPLTMLSPVLVPVMVLGRSANPIFM